MAEHKVFRRAMGCKRHIAYWVACACGLWMPAAGTIVALWARARLRHYGEALSEREISQLQGAAADAWKWGLVLALGTVLFGFLYAHEILAAKRAVVTVDGDGLFVRDWRGRERSFAWRDIRRLTVFGWRTWRGPLPSLLLRVSRQGDRIWLPGVQQAGDLAESIVSGAGLVQSTDTWLAKRYALPSS